MTPTVVRLSDSLRRKVDEAALRDGHGSISAFLRSAIEEKVSDRRAALNESEQRMAASLDRIAKQLRKLETVLQAHFAFTDALAKLILICVPEPPKDVFELAKAKAKVRYEKLLRGVAENMVGEARATLSELVDRDD
jgi:hypothetical protein